MGCQGRRGIHRVLCALLLGALVWGAPAAGANTIAADDVQTGESGSAVFNVTRDAGWLSGATTVDFQTVDGGASGADYVAASGRLTFGSAPLGATQVLQVVVAVRPDALDEDNESFRLALSGPEVGDDSATATIVDDDATPSLSVFDSAAVTEGAPGAQAAFVVRLSAVSGRSVSVSYATANAGATAGQDYTARAGTLVLAPGSAQATVAVAVLDDAADEPAESFELRLASPQAASLGDGTATATIVDDDEPPAPPPPAAPAGGTQQPSNPSVALPQLGASAPTAGSSTAGTTRAALGISSPRLKRPSTVLVTVSCPASVARCSGRITLFSVPNARSRIKALRHERKLGRLTFAVAGGRAQTLALNLGRSDLALLRRTGRMRVRAYALTQDSGGRTGVRSVSGTLISRTAHSSPSRRR
ncbi:MAG: hypothetical protein QOE31_3385 [Solirubrobacteraceae bacterium]|nr:hypothetical protein [Solirubrobacteraceae bacterium]